MVDQNVVAKLRADRENRRMADLTRELAIRIKTATRRVGETHRTYDLIDKDDIAMLIRGRQDVMNWQVRRRTLIEMWELATGEVWSLGGFKDE